MPWMIPMVSADVFGNNQRTSGPTILDVLLAENWPVDAKKINPSQISSGR
jgi:hypothetical protein